jgi:hypothetical protein
MYAVCRLWVFIPYPFGSQNPGGGHRSYDLRVCEWPRDPDANEEGYRLSPVFDRLEDAQAWMLRYVQGEERVAA